MVTIPGYLTILVECMLTVAAVDKDLASPEMDLIRNLVEANWNEEYGDMDNFIRGVAWRLSERSTSTGLSLERQFQYYTEYLKEHLTHSQKDHLIHIIDKMILADHFIDKRERDLVEYLKNRFNSFA